MNRSLFARSFTATCGKLIVLVGLFSGAAIPQSRASVSAVYRTPQHSNLGATVDFDFSISGASVTDANGQTEVDQIQKYIVSVSGGPSWTYQLSGGQFYSGSFVDPRGGISTPGIYTFTLVAYGDRPFAYDQWVEGHEDPNDPEVWIEAHQEVGIDWSYGEIGRASLVFYIGVSATPLILTQPSPCEVTLGKQATFVVSTVAEYSQTYRWQRRTSPGAAWLDINEDAMISISSSSSGSGATSNALTIVAIVPGQSGSQFRCIASTSSGSTTSDIATLSVRTEALADNPLLSLSYAASQIYPAPATPRFNISFQAGTYTATSGEQQSDWINAFTVAASDGWAFTYTRYNAPWGFTGAPIPFEGSLTVPGAYIYIVTVVADHPEPYDRWIEGHWEPIYENPDDPEDVTYEWADAYREIGFEWQENAPIASEILPFFVGTFTAQTSAPPVVIRQPDPATVDEGGVATFRIAVLSEALPTFRWQRLASGTWTDVSDGGGFSGATTPNLAVSATSEVNGSQFRCVAANAVGSAVSSGASLTVSLYSPPAFVQHPASVDVLEGTGVTLSVVTSGYPEPTYAWEGSYDGVTGWMDAGGGRVKQVATYAGFHRYFRCIATNSRGTATSSIAEVKTHPYVVAPTIAQHPTNRTTDAGWGVWLHVLATGTSLSYQWQQSWMPNSDWLNLTNNSTYQDVTTDTLKVTSPSMSMNGLYYRCVVSNSAGTVMSNSALLTVQTVFGITQQPQNLTVAAGASGAFVASAIGDPAPSYWWQRWDGTGWRDYGFDSHYSGVTTSTLTVSNAEMAMTGARFRCFVNSGSRSVTSTEVTLTVDSGPPPPPLPVIAGQPQSQTAAVGNTIALFVNVTSSSSVTYQWTKDGEILSGQTMPTLALLNVTAADAGGYNVVVTNNAGSVTSATAHVIVDLRKQTILFFALPNRPLSDAILQLGAVASSGLPVSYTASGPATISGNQLSLTGAGVISITASQPGNSSFDPADPVTRSFTVVAEDRPTTVPIAIPGQAALTLATAVPSNERMWFDVDRDGILDEIIPANTLGFHYDIYANDVPDLAWEIQPIMQQGPEGRLLWGYVPTIVQSNEAYVSERFYCDEPEADYEYMLFGEANHRYGDRVENWTIGSRRRFTANEIGGGVWQLDQPLSSLASVSYYLIRFGKAPTAPNWTWEGIANDPDPIRYYMADRPRFLGLFPNWGLDRMLQRSIEWDPDAVPDAYSLEFTHDVEALMAGGMPAAEIPIALGQILLPFPQLGSTNEEQVAGAAALAKVLAQLNSARSPSYTYIVYQMQNRLDPNKYYVGRTRGWGEPGRVLAKRQQNHERRIDHKDATINAMIWQEIWHVSSHAAMRGREQQLIDYYGGLVQDGGRATNLIRAVWWYNPAWKLFHLTSTAYWGEIAPYPYNAPDRPATALSTPSWIYIYMKWPQQ